MQESILSDLDSDLSNKHSDSTGSVSPSAFVGAFEGELNPEESDLKQVAELIQSLDLPKKIGAKKGETKKRVLKEEKKNEPKVRQTRKKP
jgi:hypothetical protein